MDGAVGERGGEHLVHAPVLVDQRKAVEVRARDGDLEVVARAGAVLDAELGRTRECSLEQRANDLCLHGAMVDARRYAPAMRLFRTLLVFKLGFWGGTFASAALLRRAFPSRGDADSDELRLVAIMNGIELTSRAQAFRGGSMFTWLGGIAVDLREAQLAPDAHLELGSLFGGIALRVPPGWRVESELQSLAGGIAIDVPTPESDAAPTLRLTGFSAFGGIAVGAKPPS